MTRRDFRTRRGLFDRQMRSNRDFDAFTERYTRKRKSGIIKWIVVVLIVVVISVLVYAISVH